MTKGKLYGIYNKRGLWMEIVKGPKGGMKRVMLFGKAEAEKKAEKLASDHKLGYWVREVLVTEVAE